MEKKIFKIAGIVIIGIILVVFLCVILILQMPVYKLAFWKELPDIISIYMYTSKETMLNYCNQIYDKTNDCDSSFCYPKIGCGGLPGDSGKDTAGCPISVYGCQPIDCEDISMEDCANFASLVCQIDGDECVNRVWAQ